MTHIAWLYMQDFYDYTKAVSYNLRAQELAEKHHSYEYMPFIINNNANIRELTGFYENSEDFDMEVVAMQKQAFAMALEQEQWHALYTSFINLAMRTTFEGREDLIQTELDTIKSLYPPEMTTHFKYARCLAEGIQAMHEQHPDSAVVCFNRLLDIAQEHDNQRQQALSSIIANDFLFLCYGEMEEHEKVLAALKANEAQFLFQLNQKNEEVREMAYREKMRSRMLTGVHRHGDQ